MSRPESAAEGRGPGAPGPGGVVGTPGKGQGPLRVRVRFFGPFRELAGTGERSVELPPDATVRRLLGLLRATPELAGLPLEPTVAVNRQYASLDSRLRSGDEVAFIPPVAGG